MRPRRRRNGRRTDAPVSRSASWPLLGRGNEVLWLALQKGTRGDPVVTLTVEEVFEPGRRGGTNDGDRLPRPRGLRHGRGQHSRQQRADEHL